MSDEFPSAPPVVPAGRWNERKAALIAEEGFDAAYYLGRWAALERQVYGGDRGIIMEIASEELVRLRALVLLPVQGERADAFSAARENDNGVALIAAERRRQVEEGWTEEHDDRHGAGELAGAAACYALPARLRREGWWAWGDGGRRPYDWPWDSEWWKPTPNDRIRELVKAGALIAAEIDRLQRAEARDA